MTASAEYTEQVMELLAPFGRVRTGRFFGGAGLSMGGVQFSMIMGNSLYFVVDDNTRSKQEKAGMAPFSYLTKKGRIQVRRYFELPEEIITDPPALKIWVEESRQLAAKTKKTTRKKAVSVCKPIKSAVFPGLWLGSFERAVENLE